MQKVTLRLNPDYKPNPPKPQPVGLGSKLKKVIHKVLDAVPMPAKTRHKIKTCGGCRQREQILNDFAGYRERLAARRAASRGGDSKV